VIHLNLAPVLAIYSYDTLLEVLWEVVKDTYRQHEYLCDSLEKIAAKNSPLPTSEKRKAANELSTFDAFLNDDSPKETKLRFSLMRLATALKVHFKRKARFFRIIFIFSFSF
jgi:hypothetical protein